MFKKFLTLSAMCFAMASMSACSSDSTSNAQSSTEQNSCKATKTSSNKVVTTMTVAGTMTSTTETTLNGDKANIKITTNYTSMVPASVIKETCSQNKEEAAERNDGSTVTCEDRTITIKAVENAEAGIEQVYKSALKTCESFYKEFPEGEIKFDEEDDEKDEDDEDINDEHISPIQPGDINDAPVANQSRATCKITKNSDLAFEMVAADADTATMTISYNYDGSYAVQTAVVEFNRNLPQSFVDQECAKTKEDALVDDDGTIVICDDYTIKEIFRFESPINPLPFAFDMLKETCDEIQRTGVIPDDEF